MEMNMGFGPIDIAVSGLRAGSKRMEVISSNVANARSTDNGNGEPYRRLEAVFKTDGDGLGGVVLDEVAADMSDFQMVLKPGHPDADEQGYVTMPNVNIVEEMVNMISATRSYEAGVAAINASKSMALKALEIGR